VFSELQLPPQTLTVFRYSAPVAVMGQKIILATHTMRSVRINARSYMELVFRVVLPMILHAWANTTTA
jgi:hypothetical protein